MELLSVNIATSRTIQYQGRSVSTGIFKQPIMGPARATVMGITGDIQVDRKNHGGVDKAIYVYTVENYRHWELVLGGDTFPYGQFGENFTVSGMPDQLVCLGDIFRIGNLIVQVSQPRVPCFKLGVKMGDPAFVKAFLHSGRVGFYVRVLEEGSVTAGDQIERIAEDPDQINIGKCMLVYRSDYDRQAVIARILRVPALSKAWRDDLEQRLVLSSTR